MPGPANYITLNPRSTDAIRHIFKLRSGASNLRDDKATRQLSNTSTCRHCGEFDETARHIFDQYAALASISVTAGQPKLSAHDPNRRRKNSAIAGARNPGMFANVFASDESSVASAPPTSR